MPPTSKLRIALIGLGDIADKAYLPLMTTHPGVEPVLCTRDADKLSELAARYRIAETYTDLSDLLDHRPDAAMVHSATESHAALVTALLEAGIPTFVDKPLSDSLTASAGLIDLARAKNCPLFVGFNRRYAPLISALKAKDAAIQMTWHKNRVDLPGDPRRFVFDDFIHVVDSLRFLGEGPVRHFTVHTRMRGDGLANVQVRWLQGDCLLTGGMNRVSGITEETVEYYTPGHKWQIEELHRGYHYHGNQTDRLGFGNWTPTLEQRGFGAMIDHWIAVVRGKPLPPDYLDGVLESHRLCEEIVGRVGDSLL
ncbi:virulence factor [Neolewinella xylanilytica]|uniref:Virulence factor n=1 Tax=Neolewinella xylanilytica TaxID=1514080 RepID=A0A2S6I9B3_9BACT|nr:Gfo/Idh/MocA family oxidoreductase [Neolewinella xylanilytica]PPK88090.1 virulence factor [Neolewinella xylanilytica]